MNRSAFAETNLSFYFRFASFCFLVSNFQLRSYALLQINGVLSYCSTERVSDIIARD